MTTVGCILIVIFFLIFGVANICRIAMKQERRVIKSREALIGYTIGIIFVTIGIYFAAVVPRSVDSSTIENEITKTEKAVNISKLSVFSENSSSYKDYKYLFKFNMNGRTYIAKVNYVHNLILCDSEGVALGNEIVLGQSDDTDTVQVKVWEKYNKVDLLKINKSHSKVYYVNLNKEDYKTVIDNWNNIPIEVLM